MGRDFELARGRGGGSVTRRRVGSRGMAYGDRTERFISRILQPDCEYATAL